MADADEERIRAPHDLLARLFVVASVTALAGLMATAGASGCSGLLLPDTPDAAAVTGEAGNADTGPAALADASPIDPGDSFPDEPCSISTPVTAAQIEKADGPFKPPAAKQMVCTQQNLDDPKALFVPGMSSPSFTAIQTALGTTCAACVFTKEADATWGPIVAGTSGNGYLQNDGPSCVSQLEGATCGKSYFEADNCLRDVCPADICTDQQRCTTEAARGPCKGVIAQANTDCPDLDNALKICGGIVDSISVNCGGWVQDASTNLDSSVQ